VRVWLFSHTNTAGSARWRELALGKTLDRHRRRKKAAATRSAPLQLNPNARGGDEHASADNAVFPDHQPRVGDCNPATQAPAVPVTRPEFGEHPVDVCALGGIQVPCPRWCWLMCHPASALQTPTPPPPVHRRVERPAQIGRRVKDSRPLSKARMSSITIHLEQRLGLFGCRDTVRCRVGDQVRSSRSSEISRRR